MKKILFSLALLLTVTVGVAQTNKKNAQQAPQKPTPEQVTNQMASQLSLTDAQKKKVLALNNQYKDVIGGGPGMGGPGGPQPPKDGQTTDKSSKKAAKKQKGSRPEPPQMTDAQKKEMQQHMQKRQAYDKQLQKILSTDQYKKYQQSQPGPGGHGGPQSNNASGPIPTQNS